MNVRIAGISPGSVTGGPGLLAVLFFQGCTYACAGCHTPQTWDQAGGTASDVMELLGIFRIPSQLSGCSLSGDEPFLQAPVTAKIAELVRSHGLNLWVYMGFPWEVLIQNLVEPGYRKMIGLADAIVEGPFRKELRDLSLPSRGSSNHRILAPRSSLEQQKIVLLNNGRR
jgi:anaerobic ribonucleoside-triphosphate reductase activating protein